MQNEPTTTTAEAVATRGEALTYHGPGWTLSGPGFDVTCWAPGNITHDGQPTGRHRDHWMLSVETDGAHAESSGFTTGDSLTEVLAAVAFLPPRARYLVTAVLVHELGELRTTQPADHTREDQR
ncbi:MAG: hypothetical protein AAF962_27865 [Actinomycetota bacterium]